MLKIQIITFLIWRIKHFNIHCTFFSERLDENTVHLINKHKSDAICIFVNDICNKPVIEQLSSNNIKTILMRCSGFNNVDVSSAQKYNIPILRVPAYSPNSIAEHTIAMILNLSRKIHKSYHKTRLGNFTLDGLLGFDLCNKTIGIIGTGNIGAITARILNGFGSSLIAYDPYPNPEVKKLGVQYTECINDLLSESDIVTLHCPLSKSTQHIIDQEAIKNMKDGSMLINTSRGGLVDTNAVVDGLESGKLGSLGIDVYENEANVFFEDWSDRIMHDQILTRLMTFPNVIITSHQAFYTEDALTAIAQTTLQNATDFAQGKTKQENIVEPNATYPFLK